MTMKYYLGMDIGGTKCAVVLCEKDSQSIYAKKRFDTKSERGWRAVTDELIGSASELMKEKGIKSEDVIACGVSCGGPLNPDTGVIMCPPNLPDWDNVPLADMVKERLGIPCKVRNDADACALAEWQFGSGKGTKSMIFLTFGTGMGAGLILDGRLYSGFGGTAGEVGHIRLASDGPVGYGKAGSFEGFCSGGGLAKLGEMMLSDYKGETLLESGSITAKSIAEAAKQGDELSLSIYRKCGEKLGEGLSVLIDILNPERIVIGSIFQRSGELMKEEMNAVIRREALSVNAAQCQIVPALLGDEIGDFAAIGVAREFAEVRNG